MTDWQFPTTRVLIFCKAPVVGQVKTRLIPALGARGARDLHQRLAQHIFTMCQQAAVAPVQLWCAPDTTDEFFVNSGLPLYQQQGADLGERMNHGLTTALAESGVTSAILMGTDCINLDVRYLRQACLSLQDSDAVLGPAEDGGYGLIGLSQPAPEVFAQIAWSTDTVCADTARHFNHTFQRWALLPLLWDLDRPADLLRYQQGRKQGNPKEVHQAAGALSGDAMLAETN
jgi:rSAM/selenodomain-associated transferase 1